MGENTKEACHQMYQVTEQIQKTFTRKMPPAASMWDTVSIDTRKSGLL